MITIIDYGIGNLGSVHNMLKRIRVESEITNDINKISVAKKILLPGVGAFDSGMNKINNSGLREILDRKALIDKIPILGICLGMQLLTMSSEEGVIPGLGWIPAKTFKFNFSDPKFKVPHMGWNTVHLVNKSELTLNFSNEMRFYFVHSFYVKTDNEKDVIANTNYGYNFSSIIQHNNIYGAQFHPEKSHKFGMKLLHNFAII